MANGSSVPVWPTARVPSTRRTRCTTSCEVSPAGLSTSTAPISSGSSRSRPCEQLVDPRRVREAQVELEVQLGHRPGRERAGRARPEKAGGALQPFERPLPLGLLARARSP